MRVSVASDLHVNYHDWPIDYQDADVLVIAGDTSNDMLTSVSVFWEASERYRDVIVIDGNHDHWTRTDPEMTIEENIASILDRLPPNVHFLGHHRPSVMLNGVKFIGVNGWYSADYAGDPGLARLSYRDYADYKRIFEGTNQLDPWYRARNDADLVIRELSENLPSVVATHTIPHRSCVRNGPEYTASNNFFYNSYMQEILESDLIRDCRMWIFGHTHDRMEKMIGNTIVHSNPRGHRSENPRWWMTTYDV